MNRISIPSNRKIGMPCLLARPLASRCHVRNTKDTKTTMGFVSRFEPMGPACPVC